MLINLKIFFIKLRTYHIYSTPKALNTASSALLKKIKLKRPTSSGGTVPRSTAEVIGNNTFFAPESRRCGI